MTRTWLARLAVTFLGFVVWILPLEVAARYWTERFGDSLDHSMRVLRMDTHLGWRQREGFRGRFLGLPLRTDALGLRNPPEPFTSAAELLIVVLGPSSTFGWGLEETQTYSRRLERLIRERRPGLDVSVVNAGEIGFSSWQGLELYREAIRPMKANVAVFAYGVNDVDHHRFFFDSPEPDSSVLGRGDSPGPIALRNALAGLQMFHVARRKLHTFLDGVAGCPLGASEGPLQHQVPSLRVPFEEFGRNVEDFVDCARREGTRVVLLTSGFKLPQGENPSASQARRAQEALEAGQKWFKARDYAKASEAFEASLRVSPQDCRAAYFLSAAYRLAGRCPQAREARALARKLEPYRIESDLRRYNMGVREIARRHKIPLVDAEAVLDRDPASFLDPIHPSVEGHRRIAEALFGAMASHGLLEKK